MMTDIPVVRDDHDQLLDLVVSYGAVRFEAGYRLANADPRLHQSTAVGNVALDKIATLITQLQRKDGGGQ